MRTRMTCSILVTAVVALLFTSVFASVAPAEETKEAKIARAMRAAPEFISKNATIVDLDGTVLRPGSNGWHCHPGIAPGDDHPMCNDHVWMNLMKAVADKTDFKTDRVGISYMLEGDALVNNADPFDTKREPGEVWVQEGPHLMIVVPDPKQLEGFTDDPNVGGPYIMWKGTPYVHLMVPVAPRPEAK